MAQRIYDLADFNLNPGDDLSGVFVGVDVPNLAGSRRITMDQIVNPYVLKATGVGATDKANFEAACLANDAVVIDDSQAPLVFDSGGTVRAYDTLVIGRNGRARINLFNATRIWFGDYLNLGASNAFEAATVSADKTTVTAGTLVGVQEGDLLFITSDDPISGTDPHHVGGETRPGEWGYVVEVNGTSYQLQTKLVDTYNTNVRVYHLPGDGSIAATSTKALAINCGLVDIDFTGSANGAAQYQYAAQFYTAFRPIAQNVRLNNCGGLLFAGCYQGQALDVKCDGQVAGHWQYSIAFLVSDECIVDNYDGRNARHHVTTGGWDDEAGGGVRVGTNRYNVVRNSRAYALGEDSITPGEEYNIAFDNHAESYGMVFEDCTVYLSGTQSTVSPASGPWNIGFNARGRATKLIRCTVDGGDNGKTKKTSAFRVFADDCAIVDCEFRNLWFAVDVRAISQSGHTPQRFKAVFTEIENCRNEGVVIHGGDGHVLDRCAFVNCSSSSTGFFGAAGAAVTFANYWSGGAAPTNVQITSCMFPAGPGDSINFSTMTLDNITIRGCRFDGYTNCEFGFDRTSSIIPDLERKIAPLNYRTSHAYYTRTGHSLTTDQIYFPIDSRGEIWDNTYPFIGILADVIDGNHIVIASPGQYVDVPYDMVNGIATYSPTSDGYYLRWDGVNEGYSVNGDNLTAPYLLETLDYTTSGLHARVYGSNFNQEAQAATTPTDVWEWEDGQPMVWEDDSYMNLEG